MNISLINKNALVGGSSQGIGKACAVSMAKLGASITLMARNEEKLEQTLAALDTSQGQQHHYLVVDNSYAQVLVNKVRQHMEQHQLNYHILINNTGGPPAGPITKATIEAFAQAYNNHLLCNQLLAQLTLEGMRSQAYGRIINIISTSVKVPIKGLGVSNTTRWAVAAWAKTWANEVGPLGITVNNVLPGFTNTARLDSIVEKRASKGKVSPEQAANAMKATVPMQRFGTPEEVAAAVAFLASPAASYINGINLPVDGGRTGCL